MLLAKTHKQTKKLTTLSMIAGSLLLAAAPVTYVNAADQDLTTYSDISVQGKNVFEKYGLEKDLPKLAMNSLIQGDHLVEHAYRKITLGDEVQESSVFLVKNTDEKGNIDLHIKYNPSEVDENENFIEQIENYTRNEYQLRNYAESYDSSSVKATEDDNGDVRISFNYSKYGLPQDIAYFRFLKVEILLVDGKPVKMEISNDKPFADGKYDVENYQQVITFDQLASGQLVIGKKEIKTSGTKRGKAFTSITVTEPVAFYDDDSNVEIVDEARLNEVSDPRMRDQSVKLDRIFPLMGDMVRRQGIDLPLPFGVSVAYRNQDMDIPFNDFTIQGVRLNDLFDPEDSFGVVNAESINVRADINILPFWNVFGYLGKIDVNATVDAGYTGAAGETIRDKLNDLTGLPLGDAFCNGETLGALCRPGRLGVPLHLEYDLVGVGTTLSVGYREFFASVTGTYTQTRLKGVSDWGDGIVTVQPMLGYQLVDYRAQIFVGAEYQGLDARMAGHVVTGDIEFDYDIGVDLNQWAYLIGFNKQIGKHYNITALYNQGETRSAFTVNVGYRF